MKPRLEIEGSDIWDTYIEFSDFEDIKKIYTYIENFTKQEIAVKKLMLGNPFDNVYQNPNHNVRTRKYWVIQAKVAEDVREAINVLWTENEA